MGTDTMQRYFMHLSVAFLVAAGSACGGDGSGDDTGAASSGATSSGSGSGGSTSGSGATSSATTGTGGSATSASGTGGGTGAGGDSGGFTNVGVCGERGEGTVDAAETFEGFWEFYIIGDDGLGDDVCVVRFDAARAGEAPEGCDMFAGQQDECLWTHLVELSNPMVMLDEDGVCENSELGLDEAAMMEIEGSQGAYGFVSEYAGHNSVLLKYEESSETWVPNGNATWDEETGAFRFDRRDGFCDY
jgi:hypothetical protein